MHMAFLSSFITVSNLSIFLDQEVSQTGRSSMATSRKKLRVGNLFLCAPCVESLMLTNKTLWTMLKVYTSPTCSLTLVNIVARPIMLRTVYMSTYLLVIGRKNQHINKQCPFCRNWHSSVPRLYCPVWPHTWMEMFYMWQRKCTKSEFSETCRKCSFPRHVLLWL